MLIRYNQQFEAKFKAAMNMAPADYGPAWPLPNMKPAEAKDFWATCSSNGWQTEAYLGHKRLEGYGAGTALIFFAGNSGNPVGGFVVLYDHRYRDEKVHYFTWTQCEHDWNEKTIGRCLHKVTCQKCKASYEYDSGD